MTGHPKVFSRSRAQRGFSLVEVVMVVVVIGTISAIAVPRLSQGAGGAQTTAIAADIRQFQTAIDIYSLEHMNRTPGVTETGGVETDERSFVKRLLVSTDESGALNRPPFGPYLRKVPINPRTRLDTVRLGGTLPPAGTHGWYFHAARGMVIPDDPEGVQVWLDLFLDGRVRAPKDTTRTINNVALSASAPEAAATDGESGGVAKDGGETLQSKP